MYFCVKIHYRKLQYRRAAILITTKTKVEGYVMKIYASNALFAIAIMVLSAHAQAQPHVPLAYGQAADETEPTLAAQSYTQSARVQKKSVQTLQGVSARTFASLAPDLNSGDRALYRPNAMTGGEQNASVGVGSSAFTPLPETHVFNPSDIVTWQNPRPRLEVGLDVISTQNQISLNRLSYRITSSDVSSERPNGSIFFTGNLDGTYTTTRLGIPYGNDRQKGTADDPQRLMSGSASQSFVGEIVYIGFGIFYNTPTQADAEAVRRYIIEKNLTIKFEYFLDNILIAQRVIRFAPQANPPAPSINSFTASAPQVVHGQNVSINWNVSPPGTVVSVSNIGSNLEAVGGRTIALFQTTTFTLSATSAGSTVSQSITVTVSPAVPSPRVISFSATPTTVQAGQPVQLQWNTEGGVAVLSNTGGVSAAGNLTVNPTQTTVYTLTVTGPSGTTPAQATMTVTVTPLTPPSNPTISFFTADRTSILVGESTVLRWSSANGTGANIPGVGSNLPASGQISVTPSITSSYSLTVFGTGGTSTAPTITIVVNPPPPPAVNLSLSAQLAVNGAILPVGGVVVHNVFTGSNLELKGEIRNIGTGSTAFTGLWQYRLVQRIVVNDVPQWQVVMDWLDWVGDGIATSSIPLQPNTSHNTGYEWKPAGPGNLVYQFRLLVNTTDGKRFVSPETPAITVTVGAGGASIPQAVVKLIPVLSAAPGVYDFQRSTNLVTWTTLQRIDTRSGVPLVILPEGAFAGPFGFFRAVQIQ